MDVTLIFVPDAQEALQSAIRGGERFSPIADIEGGLGRVSDALDAGVELPDDAMIPVETTSPDGMTRQSWVTITPEEGMFTVIVPNPNWTGGWFVLVAQVSDNHKVWIVRALTLGGHPIDR